MNIANLIRTQEGQELLSDITGIPVKDIVKLNDKQSLIVEPKKKPEIETEAYQTRVKMEAIHAVANRVGL